MRSGSASESGVQRLGARIVFVALESVAIESPERDYLAAAELLIGGSGRGRRA